VNVLLLGPPGSGKGTQGVRLAAHLGVTHIATGDLLRGEVAAGTPTGQRAAAFMASGELVPDEMIMDLVMPRVLEAAAAGGYVLDGFPRTVVQARAARDLAERIGASPHVVIYLDVPSAELTRRMLGRARAQGRADDTAGTITHRIEVFERVTRPLVEHYRERGLLRLVDANRSPAVVFAAIVSALTAD
jgi:adenylate kinase